jgi:hypothetical protein
MTSLLGGQSLEYEKGKNDEAIENTLDLNLEEFDSSNVVVNKKKSSNKDNRGGRHGSSRDDANRSRDA